jgi:signal transduction histidine kinase
MVSAVPFKNLEAMLGRLRLEDEDRALLARHSGMFIAKKDEFAEFFFSTFFDLPETHIILERYGGEAIKRIWASWFERLFRDVLSRGFIGYLWRIGIRHVEINLDQRFSNLGFSLVRQFCHRTVLEGGLPPEEASRLIPAVDKLVDSCILVETSAYIEATVRCDVEILRGIADKIRNPMTIIGGNLRRLQRRTGEESPLYGDFGFLISYMGRCEDMLEDIGTYIELFGREAVLDRCMLPTIVEEMVAKLADKRRLEGVKVELDISPEAPLVLGDPVDLRRLFRHIIENAADASRTAESPWVRISSAPQGTPPHTVRVEVFNNGEPINMADIAAIMSPFYSTKPEGSGLGLSIARLVLRKNFGEMSFEPVPGEGTRVIITLQKAE